MENLAVFINTSDGFDDCWDPFFDLFYCYTDKLQKNIYLNTEAKSYAHSNLEINCTKVNSSAPNRKLTWSEATKIGIQQTKEDFILYFQEDYFLTEKIDEKKIAHCLKMMSQNQELGCVQLTNIGSRRPFLESDYRQLAIIPAKAKYSISTQVALWRKEVFLKYLEDWESGWQFEIFGTLRARDRTEVFSSCVLNQDSKPPVNYLATGIIKGKWHKDTPDLMAKHDIIIDYRKRGFVNKNLFWQKVMTIKKLLQSPCVLMLSVLSIYQKK